MNAPFENPFRPRSKGRARQRASPPFRRRILFEALEPRLLLSADTASPALAEALAASLVPTQQQESAAPLQDTTPVLITSALDESAVADPTAASWIIELPDGTRALQASGATDNVWRITGADSGTLNGVAFSDVGTLLGGADNEDTFILEQGGSLSGGLDGGPGGFDTLVIDGAYDSLVFTPTGPDSGNISVDGQLVTYAGLEPVNAGTAANVRFDGTAVADDWVIEDSATPGQIQVRSTTGAMETTSFGNPTTLVIDLGLGDDSLTLDSLGDSGFNGSILVNGQDGSDTLNVAADLTLIKSSDGSAVATDGLLGARFVNFESFSGGNATITEQGLPNWLSEGPGPITGGQTQLPDQNIPVVGTVSNPVVGAVNQIVSDPFDPNVLFAATVGGGVWRNSDRTVFFDTGVSAPDADSMLILNDYASFLKANPDLVVQVVGYTDNTPNGNPGGNPQLALDRANGVASYLESQGVRASQLVISGQGESNPIASNATDAGKALNRRVEIVANHWTPLTDQFPSLAIGSIALSPRDALGDLLTATTPRDNLVLYAGTGQFSSNRQGGAAVGLYKSTDGGDSWVQQASDELGNLRITSVVATGIMSGGQEIVLVSALSSEDGSKTGGIFRSTNGGQHFDSLVAGSATALVVDPGKTDRFYAAVLGQGVLVSDGTDGATWAATVAQPTNAATADRIVLSVQANAGNANNAVFAELEAGGTVSGVFRSPNQGGAWAAFGPVPVTGGAADFFMSLQASADGTHAFIGGASSAAGMGNLFLGDGAAWNPVVQAGANATVNTAPHADSHRLAFDSAGRLIDADDGGMYRLSLPFDAADRAWSSVNGDLVNSEVLSIAYDALNNVVIIGNQDTGSSQQTGQPPVPVDLNGDGLPDDFITRAVWQQILQADGQGQLAVPVDATHVLRFSMSNGFRFFVANLFDNTGAMVSGDTVGLRNAPGADPRTGLELADRAVANSPAFDTIPYVVNAVAPNRMLIALYSLYESSDRLDTIAARISSPLGADVDTVHAPAPNTAFTALAYGGKKGTDPKPDIIYAARGNTLFVRVDGAANNVFTDVSINGSGAITSIVMDPDDWETVYATDGTTVWKSTTHGAAHQWTVVSQNLDPIGGSVKTLEVVKNGSDTVLLAGTSANVYRAINPAANVTWVQAGLGLPNTVVRDLQFADLAGPADALFAGTQGRGAWSLRGDVASELGTASTLVIDGTAADDTFTITREAGNNLLVDISVNSVTPVLTVPLDAIQSVVIHTGGGSDQLIVDSSNGTLSFPDGISFDGDAGTTVQLDGGSMVDHSSSTAGGTTTFGATLQGDNKTETVSFGQNATFTNNLTTAGDDAIDGAGLQQFLDWLDQLAQLPTSGDTTQPDLALLGASLLSAIMGVPLAAPEAEGDSAESASPGAGGADAASLRRLFESGTGAFDLGSIGSDITTFAQLKTALEGLGGTVTGSDLSSVQFHLVKNLDGEAALDGNFDFGGGQVALDGSFGVQAQVDLNLSFGVDGSGFFVDTSGTSLAVNHITLNGDGHADGRFGFLDVAADVDTLTVDPTVGLSVALSAPGDKLRLTDLGGSLDTHVAVAATGAHTDDIALKLDVQASALIPGIDSIDLGGAQLTIDWANVTDPGSATVTANAGFASDVIDFLKVDAQQVLAQIQQINQLANTFNVDIPFLSDALNTLVGFLNTFDQEVIQPLTGPVGGQASFPSAQNLAARLAQSLGVDPADLGLGFDASTGELTYHLHLAKDFSASEPLGSAVDFGNGLGGLEFSTDASIDGSFALDVDFGLDISAIASAADPLDWFFIRDPHATATLDVAATDVTAGAHIGFLGISVEGGSVSASPTIDVTLNDPNMDGRIDLRELLDGLSDPGTLVNATLGGAASASLPIVLDVGLGGFVDPNVGTVEFSATDLFDTGTYDINFNGDFSDAFQFNDLSATQILSMIGQLTSQLDALRNTALIQTALGLPVVGPAIDDMLDFTQFVHDKLLYDSVNHVDKLLDVDSNPTFHTVQEFAERLATILGLDPSVIGANYDPATKLLTFHLSFDQALTGVSAPLSLGFDLSEGLADFHASTDASIDADISFNFGFGVDLNYDPSTDDLADYTFIDDASISGSMDLAAADIQASARFGFLAIQVVDGSATAHAEFSLSLNDPGTVAADGRIAISELIAGLSDLGTLVSASFAASANVSLPLSVPFLGVSPGPTTTLGLDWTDLTDPNTLTVQLPTGFSDLGNFTHMDAGTFVSLLGQVTNWLDDLRNSLSGTSIPLVGDALDQVLKFADLFRSTLLFDDGGDGVDGSDKLIADINAALASADLGDQIAAEAKDGKVSLFAIGSGVNAFTVSGTGLGFSTLRAAATNLGRLELDGTSDAPSDGVLGGDVTLNIAINGAAAVMVSVAAASTSSNTGLGNDKRKLLDANNRPTFATVQDMAQQLVHIVGSDIVQYDSDTDEITLDLSLGDPSSTDNLGSVDLPLDFSLFNLAPIASFSSDSTIRLSAGGGLTLTLGVYLGNEGAVQLSDSTDLSTLKNGIAFSDLQTVAAANDVRTVYGQLSADASFDVSVNGADAVTVTVAKADTDANTTVDDLVADINAAIAGTSLNGKVSAEHLAGSNKVALVAQGATTSMTLSAANGNPAITQMGLRSGTSATPDEADGNKLKIKAAADVSGYVGRLTDDAVFQVSLSSVNGGSPTAVTVHKSDTDANRNILDVVADVQRALNTAGFTDKVKVSSLGMGLVFSTLVPGDTGFAISAVGGSVAANELGLATSATGSSADLLITTRDGVQHGIVLDGVTTLGGVVSAIETQTSGSVTVEYSDNDTRLKLYDHTSGGSNFKIENAPGTKATVDTQDINHNGNTTEILYGPNTAAIDLGIYGEIVPSDDPSAPIPLDQLEGGQLGGVDPLERLFVRNAQAAATLSVSTPQLDENGQVADTDGDGSTEDGLNATAMFGFVGVEASGGGHLTGTVNIGLKRPEDASFDPNAKITLKDLVDHVGELGSFLDGPNIGGDAQFDLEVSLTPAFPAIGTGAHPMLHLAVTDLGGLITDSAHASNYYTITTEGFDQLANFSNIGFGDILTALRALADFLGQFEQFGFLHDKIPLINVSVDDLLSFADEFSSALDQVQSNPAATVQVLETKLREAFGLSPTSDLLSLDLVDDGSSHILRIGLNFSPEFSSSLPIDLTLPVDTGPIDLSGAANLHAEGKLAMTLDLGIDLTDPTQFWVFGDTGIHGGLGDPGDNTALELSAEDIAFTAALGPIGARIVGGSASADVSFNLGIKDAALTGSAGDRRILLTDLVGNLGADIDASLGGSISGTLPVYFPTESIHRGDITFGGTLTLTPEDGLDVHGNVGPSGTDFVNVPDEIFSLDFSQFSPLDNLLLIIDGLDGFLGLLQDTFSGDIGGISLPVIGDQLAGAADVIGSFRTGFVAGLRNAIETAATPDQNYISQQLFHLLHDQLHILGDRNHDGSVTIADIELDTNINDPGTDWHDLSMEWKIELGGSLVNAGAGINFDIGVPGLGLETRGAVQANIDWQLDFGFGVDMQRGFFIDVADTNELEVNVDVTLPGAGLTGRLGFLQVDADDKGNTHLGLTFGVDVKNRVHPSDTKLGFANLGDIGIDVGIAAEAVVDLDLDLKLNSDLVGADVSKVFPKIVGEFLLDWHIGDRAAGTLVALSDIGNAIEDGLHLVEFKGIGLDLGSFISDFLGPVVHQIQQITEPIQPLVDVLTAPIPVISDLAGKPITLIDIAGMTGYVQPDLIYAIADIISLVNSIPDPSEVGSLIIPFGDFVVYDSDGGNGYQPALWDAGFDPQSVDVASRTPSFDFSSALSGVSTGGDAHSETTKSFSNGFAGHSFGDFISFPIFQHPEQIFGLLMGHDATLIAVDLPPLDFKFTYSQYFPIFGPLGASITGTLGATIDFGPIGYDTHGLKEFFDSGFSNPAALFDGFYISDTAAVDGSGPDVPEVKLTGGLSAAAEINLGIAQAGVAGGIFLEVDFDLHDPNKDGKIRLDELAKNFLNEANYGSVALAPLAIFDVTGKIYAKLFAFLKVDLFLFSIDKTFDITPEITLVDFNIPFTRVPTLANELSDGTLQLNMGTNAGLRLEGDISDGSENFTVEQGSDAQHVKVTAYGYTQEYTATNKIIIRAGEGDDSIDLSKITNSALTYDIDLGAGNDTLILAETAGAAVIKGGTGDDKITGGGGNDIIYGGGGNDIIDAGGGDDLVFADDGTIGEDGLTLKVSTFGGGADTVTGGAGDDVIFGGGGNDQLGGGDGNDVLIGDGGLITLGAPNAYLNVFKIEDTDSTTGGNDVITGGLGNDLIHAGGGNDNVDGGEGNDVIWGEKGFDTIAGGMGDDEIHAGANDDTVTGGEGDDQIWGDEGKDLIHGNEGADQIWGGTGVDEIYGDAGNDKIFGESDPDKIYGGGGDDTIDGGAGNNLIYGDDKPGDSTGPEGNDHITALNDSDEIHGQGGDDVIDAGNGNNVIFADYGTVTRDSSGRVLSATSAPGAADGTDTVTTGDGNQLVFLGAGGDKLTTGNGASTVFADTSSVSFGSAGQVLSASSTSGGGDGNDTITMGDGKKVVFLGGGDDKMTSGDGDLIVFGDHGSVTLNSSGAVLAAASSADADEGDDSIVTGNGRIFAFLGSGADDFKFGNGDAFVFGDNGGITLDAGGAVLTAGSVAGSYDGKDKITGGSGAMLVYLGAGDDTLKLADGDHTVYGEDGKDNIVTGGGKDVIWAGSGDDVVDAGAGDDKIYGEDGNDIITAGLGSDNVIAADGDDIVYAGVGPGGTASETGSVNTIDTGLGDDIVYGDYGNDNIQVGAGDDKVHGLAGDDYIQGDIGNDLIWGDAGDDVIVGGRGDDTIDGGAGDDLIWGGEEDYKASYFDRSNPDNFVAPPGFNGAEGAIPTGYTPPMITPAIANGLSIGSKSDDNIATPDDDPAPRDRMALGVFGDAFKTLEANLDVPIEEFNDVIQGGDGSDIVFGGGGRDALFGGEGSDYLDGGVERDEVYGEGGDDVVRGGANDDVVHGDYMYFLGSTDIKIGTTVTPGLVGDEGIDQVYGDEGADSLFGDAGARGTNGSVDVNALGQLSATAQFSLSIDGGPDVVVTLSAADTAANGSVDDLVASLNAALSASGIDAVSARRISDARLGLVLDTTLAGSFEVTAVNSVAQAELGFAAGQASSEGIQSGQRLWGGDGIDFMYAFANVGVTASPADIAAETQRWGDEMHGEAGGDWLFGNLRRDVMFGDSGNEYIAGDYLAGPQLAQNIFANLIGGADIIHGGSGEDQLLGGGGDDELWGGADSDWLEGQQGNDTLYGGEGIDIMVLDTRREYFAPPGVGVADPLPPVDQLVASQDTFDGHYGDDLQGDIRDDNDTDIMLIEGTNQRDTILIGQLADGRIHVDFRTTNPYTGAAEQWEILAPWRANVAVDSAIGDDYFDPSLPFDPNGTPLVEQFRVSGLMRDDDIEFVADPYQANAGTPAEVTVLPLDIGDLNARSTDFVGVIDGGPGNDLLVGTAGRDRIDGGSGSDTIYGLAGDDRLWGDSTAGEESVSTSDYDIIYGGRGDDDLIGGPGINDLYAWTKDPQPPGDTDFGVYVAKVLDPETGEMIPDPTGPVYDSMAPGRVLEDTGLDRMLGSRNADRLYGGTGLSFMFGNGGDDQMFRKDGSLFESLDGGLNGDDWKNFALESGRVWYVPGTEADDIITVDFVNEPGLLGDHHLVTRLTNNNGVYSFAASVNLDFSATDDSGNPLWDGADVLLNIQQLQQRGSEQDPSKPDPSIKTTNFTSTTLGLISGATLEGLLPQEGDFDVILIDALGGDDYISVGPTVQKTVWIDAGDGDDTVVISGGNVVLADRAEFFQQRNDTAANAYPLSPAPIDKSSSYTGLTIDSPDDVDWYRFSLAQDAADNAQFALDSASNLDGLQVALYQGLSISDAPGTQGTALALDDYGDTPLVTGTSVSAGEEDWFSFNLGRAGEADDVISLKPDLLWYSPSRDATAPVDSATHPNQGEPDDWSLLGLELALVDAEGNVLASALGDASGPAALSLAGQVAGSYFLRVSGAQTSTAYEMFLRRSQSASLAQGLLQLGRDRTDLGATHDTIDTAYALPAVQSLGQVSGLTIDNANDVDMFKIDLDRGGVSGDRINLLKGKQDDQLHIALLDANGVDVTSEFESAALVQSVSLEDLDAGTYYLKVSTDSTLARYSLVFQVPALTTTESAFNGGPNTTRGTALDVGAFSIFPQVVGTSIGGSGAEEWYQFDLQRNGSSADTVTLSASGHLKMQLVDQAGADVSGALATADTDSPATLSLNGRAHGTYYLKVYDASGDTDYELSPGDKVVERTIVESQVDGGLQRIESRMVRHQSDTLTDLSGRQTTSLNLSGLEAGKVYLLQVSSPNRLPTTYDMSLDLGDDIDPGSNVTSLAAKADVTRRDVILGGAGNDVLQGGPGEDWIFGGTGNDVLSGGYDRQAEDLLFGGEGDDTFQLLPDDLPFVIGTTKTTTTTLTDRFDGGPGNDQVLYLGGDTDNLGRPVPDQVAIKWNTELQRYEFTAIPWDTANQQFDIDQQVVNASQIGPLEGYTGTVNFRLRVPDASNPDAGFVSISAGIAATDLTGVAQDLQLALNDAFGVDADGLPVVTVEFPDSILRLRAKGVGLELRTDATDDMHRVLGFDELTAPSPIYHQTYAFYQTISVEKTVINTQGGDDVVHADPEYQFPNVASEWGIDPGDYEQHGLIAGLEIYGGDGNDQLFGGALDDKIYGGAGADVIFGGGGNDLLDGGSGRDLIVGNTSLAPDSYEFTSRAGQLDRNDLVGQAAMLPSIRAGSTINGLNFDLDDNGDWYIISAADALQRFGNSTGALLTGDMIDVQEVVQNSGGVVPTGEHLSAYLYAAEDVSDPGEPMQLVPRERYSGVPKYYLLHVLDELAPSDVTAGQSLAMDGVDDTVTVAAAPSLDLTRQATVELWFKVDTMSFSGTWMPLVYKGDQDSPLPKSRDYSLRLNKNGSLEFSSGDATTLDGLLSTLPNLITAGQWYNVAAVMNRDTGQMILYLNGVQVAAGIVGTKDASTAGSDDALLIGGSYEGGNTPYQGLIDEVRIWNVARNANDILHDYERVVNSDAPGLVAYLRFEETVDAQAEPDDGGFTFLDLTAYGNDAVLHFGAGGTITAPMLDDRPGKPVSTPFGTGLYRIVFSDSLGESVHVSGDDASQTLASVDLTGQPVMIALGDINGDGFGDALVSVRDLVSDGSGGFHNYARLAFGTADGTLDPQPDWDGNPATVDQPVTLELPAPLFATDPNHLKSRGTVSAAGDIDGDGIDDVAVTVTDGLTSTVYILFGRANWAAGNIEQDAGLLGEYYYLTGYPSVTTFPSYNTLTPDLTRVDSQVNFPNTGGSFSGVADSDVFGARWTGQIQIDNAGLTRFYLASDDGSRMYIDGQLVVDNGGLHAYSEATGAISLGTGLHDIRIEYFENTGFAGVVAEWDPVGATGKEVIPTSVLFRDSRDVINVVVDSDVAMSGFLGTANTSAAHDVTPVIGDGLVGSFYNLDAPLGALALDGNGYVSVDSSDSLALTDSSTVELRFKTDIGSGTYMALLQKTNGTGLCRRRALLRCGSTRAPAGSS